uniref:CARD- and ANK-containing Inflammasome Adaptor Protein n=1 Tax=Seriola dumerili TaxID=41447 RepID=A0A3B4T4V3_SERDU
CWRGKRRGWQELSPRLIRRLVVYFPLKKLKDLALRLKTGLDSNITGPKALTPLHLAAQCNRSNLVGLLVKFCRWLLCYDGLTPLHLASQQGHADAVIQLLRDKADPGVKDRLGRTALHWAASSQGESSVVDLLLSAKANPSTTDNEKRTALHLAAMEGKLDAVTSLLSHKAKGGAKDMDGSTPLHYAAAGGHASVVSALLQSLNSKRREERNAWRKTLLHVAAEKGHDSVAVLLLEAGAKINTTDHSKDTPLHCAARGKKPFNFRQISIIYHESDFIFPH